MSSNVGERDGIKRDWGNIEIWKGIVRYLVIEARLFRFPWV